MQGADTRMLVHASKIMHMGLLWDVFLPVVSLALELEPEDKHSIFVLIAVVLTNFIVGYQVTCFGLYYVVFTETFETTKGVTGFVGAISGASSAISGICASVLIDIYGSKKISLFGSALATIGIFSSAFATNIYILFVTYGIITGCGFGVLILSSQIVIQQHFNKHRDIATFTSMCGIPIGCLLSPFITNYTLDTFGWRGALALHSGILSHMIALSLLMNPPKTTSHISQQSSKKTIPHFFKTLFNCSICKDIAFTLFMISFVFCQFNLSSFISHLPSRVVYLGGSMDSAGYLITVMWIGTLVFRILCSIIMGFVFLEPIIMFTMVVFVQGLLTAVLPFCHTQLSVFMCTLLVGCAQGLRAPSNILVIVKLTDAKRFGKGKAVSNMVSSIGSFAATPLTGLIFDVTQDYDIPFYFSGLAGIFSALMLCVVFILHTLQNRRDKITSANETFDKTSVTKFNVYLKADLEMQRIRTITL